MYGQYLNLDKDHNGMLSKEELAGWVIKHIILASLRKTILAVSQKVTSEAFENNHDCFVFKDQ